MREITEQVEPASAAAYEMEINIIGIGMGVLKYVTSGDVRARERVAKDKADFERFKQQYDQLTEGLPGKQLGDELSVLYQAYTALGDTLMRNKAAQEALFAAIAGEFQKPG